MKAFKKTLTNWFFRIFNRAEFEFKDFEKLESKKYPQSEKQKQIDQETKQINDLFGPYGGL